MTPFTIFVLVINYLSLLYVIIINLIYSLQLIVASFGLNRHIKNLKYSNFTRFIESENVVPISVLVPAYNEVATVVDNVKNLLSLDFPRYELVVINDGSKDDTLKELIKAFHLMPFNQPYRRSLKTKTIRKIYRSPNYPNLVVVDKENGGKADALNAGINVSKYPVFVSIDADSVLERQALIRIIYAFMLDPKCVAIGGMVRIGSSYTIKDGRIENVKLAKKPIIILQTVEYLRAFLAGRVGFDTLGLSLIISGAFGAFSKQAVIDVNGYTTGCIGEDMELILKLHKNMREKRKPYSIKFIADAICWTQPPESFNDLKKQRKRWQIGLMDGLLRHKNMLLNPRYGRIGMISLPYFWIFELFGPLFELLGYAVVIVSCAFGLVDLWFLGAFFLVSIFYGVILTTGALLLEEISFRKYPSLKQVLKLLLYSFIENFGYRQLNTYYRIIAFIQYRKAKHSWGEIKRKGLGK